MSDIEWPQETAPRTKPAPPPPPARTPDKPAKEAPKRKEKPVEGRSTLRGQPGDANHVDENEYGQPLDTPVDTEEELVRRRYNGGMSYDEYVDKMHAIGADPEQYNQPNEQQQPVNDDPEQPARDSARKHPGKTHKLDQ